MFGLCPCLEYLLYFLGFGRRVEGDVAFLGVVIVSACCDIWPEFLDARLQPASTRVRSSFYFSNKHTSVSFLVWL